MKTETSITHENGNDANRLLAAGFPYNLGNFQLILDEESNELKVTILKSTLRLIIKPNTDNSCTLVACR